MDISCHTRPSIHAETPGPENNIVTVIFRSHTGCKTNRDRRLNNHYRIRIIPDHQLNNRLHCKSVKEILLAVIIGRYRDHHEIRILICCLCIQGSCKIQILLSQIFLNILVLDRRLPLIDQIHFSGTISTAITS